MARRLFIVLLTFIVMTGPSMSTFAQGGPTDRLDLAAIVLSPEDPGLSEFLHEGAFDESLAAEAMLMASYLGFPMSGPEMEAFLQTNGWLRKYQNRLMLPSEQNPSRPVQFIQSYITEYQSAGGAEAVFDLFENEERVIDAVDQEPTRNFGDETDLTFETGFDADQRQFQSLDLTFRVGSRVAGVTLTVYPSTRGSIPDQALVEALGATIEGRLLEPTPAGVGRSLARLDPEQVVTYDDAYYRWQALDLPLSGESGTTAARRTDGYGDASDVYQLFQNVDSGDGRSVLYSLTVYDFSTEAAAIAWIDDAQTIIESNPYYGSMQREDVDLVAADQTSAFRFGGVGSDAVALIILGRTGEVVHRIQLVPSAGSPPVPLSLGSDLADQQIACFSSQDCMAVAVPSGFEDYFEVPLASPVAA